MKLWAGRFQKEIDQQTNSFNSSIAFDARLYRQDILGSIVHATMLEKQGLLSSEELAEITTGLEDILAELEQGTLAFDPAAEDIHMFVESELTQRIGDPGKKLHTARSRNDQVALDMKLYLAEEIQELQALLLALLQVLLTLAKAHYDTVMPGYTHLQRAQPITFGHHLMAYAGMFLRDAGRLSDTEKRLLSQSPLGSGALAGTTYPIDRHATANQLGFQAPYSNSMDGVSDRDYCIELVAACSTIMMHLSRFAEEIILWCSWEFKFIELDDAFATGSSIMPQKKNPDIAELVRGKTGRVYGDLMALLTMMKGLPLAYNKDMQEDKEATFDAIDTVKECLSIFTPMLESVTVLKDNMRKAAAGGFINATDCADYLVKQGLAFRDAYRITGELVAYCLEHNTTLEELPLAVYQEYSPVFTQEIYTAVALETCVTMRTSYGGPATVLQQVEEYKEKLSSLEL